MTTDKTIGAVFPINSSQASRFFDEGRRVFVKFTNMSNFKTNSKIVFYVTKEKVLVGEGTIKTVQRMPHLKHKTLPPNQAHSGTSLRLSQFCNLLSNLFINFPNVFLSIKYGSLTFQTTTLPPHSGHKLNT